MKLFYTEEENLHIFLTTLRNFNEIFRKDVNYDNIKSHQKAGVILYLKYAVLEKQ